jgi:hypothetical protein
LIAQQTGEPGPVFDWNELPPEGVLDSPVKEPLSPTAPMPMEERLRARLKSMRFR